MKVTYFWMYFLWLSEVYWDHGGSPEVESKIDSINDVTRKQVQSLQPSLLTNYFYFILFYWSILSKQTRHRGITPRTSLKTDHTDALLWPFQQHQGTLVMKYSQLFIVIYTSFDWLAVGKNCFHINIENTVDVLRPHFRLPAFKKNGIDSPI